MMQTGHVHTQQRRSTIHSAADGTPANKTRSGDVSPLASGREVVYHALTMKGENMHAERDGVQQSTIQPLQVAERIVISLDPVEETI